MSAGEASSAQTVFGPLRLHGIAQGGEAVGRWEGQVVFVRGALPGEVVTVRLTESWPAYLRGVVGEIRSPAPERVAPACPLFGMCGGCHWQYISYPAQLVYKQAIVAEQCRHLGHIAQPPVDAALGMADPWGYRSTAELHVDGSGRVGYYAGRSHAVVPLKHCPLLVPALDRLLAPLAGALEELSSLDRPAHVTLRYSWAEEATLALFQGGTPTGLAALCKRLGGFFGGVVAQRGRRLKRWSGRTFLRERLGGLLLRVSPTSFFQVNVPQAQRLLEVVGEMLEAQPTDHLLDAYAGVGALSLPLAGQVGRVTAIESDPVAVADLRENAGPLLRESRVEVVGGRVEEVLTTMPAGACFDLVLLDPPRRGCLPAALRAIVRLRPRRVVYVSCHPGTLARDLRVLLAGGFCLRRVQPLDLFPQTFHVESVALLEGPP